MERSWIDKLQEMAAGVHGNVVAGVIATFGVALCGALGWTETTDPKPLDHWPEWLLILAISFAALRLLFLIFRVFRGRTPSPNASALSATDAVLPLEGFVGRTDVLKSIRKEFKRYRRVVLRGGPGMGKTSTARQFAADKTWSGRYDGTAWIDASESEKIIGSIVRQGFDWDMALRPDESNEAFAQRVLNAVGKTKGCYLLVYDNVDTEESLDTLKRLAHPGNIDILITSLFDNWRGQAREIRLEKLPPEDAVRLLEERSGQSDDPKGAAALARTLDYLPLAIEYAGTMCRNGTSFAKYEAELRAFLDYRPDGAGYPRSVYATVRLAVGRAGKDAQKLLLFLAHCAPDDIPMSLAEGARFTADGAGKASTLPKALEALVNVSLVRVAAGRGSDLAGRERVISMHRLVQMVTLDTAKRSKSGAGASAALHAVLERLAMLFTSEKIKDWPAASRLIPHVIHALGEIDDRDFDEHDEKERLDTLARLTVLALVFANDGGKGTGVALPDHVARALSYCYEVEPLSGALELLLREFPQQWPQLQAQLLTANNYVLRTAMARAMGKACIAFQPPQLRVSDVAELLERKIELNAFELGGYALQYIYSNAPGRIEAGHLETLAAHPAYPGRSILGDLSINLVLQGVNPRTKFDSARFWSPVWEHVALDVWMVDAVNAESGGAPAGDDPGALAAREDLRALRKEVDALAEACRTALPALHRLLANYFQLGKDPGTLWQARAIVAKSPDLPRLMRLLLGHPLWSVQESAASVLSWLVEEEVLKPEAVRAFFDDSNWRVRFGAVEAAYQLRELDAALFDEAADRFHDDPVCRLRSLCAENLIATILNRGRREREALIRKSESCLKIWLNDDDCFVLDHVHRLFNRLGGDDPLLAGLCADGVSELLDDAPRWWELDRYRFLKHIDERKYALVESSRPAPVEA